MKMQSNKLNAIQIHSPAKTIHDSRDGEKDIHLSLSQECKRVYSGNTVCLYAWGVLNAQQTETSPYVPRSLYNTMMSEICMQNDTRSRSTNKQLIGVTRISMLSDKNHMTCIFAPTFTISAPAGNKTNSDYKTDTRIPTGIGSDFSRFVNQIDWATNPIGRVGPCHI